MLQDFSSADIKGDKKLLNSFINANLQDINLNCNILRGNFYLDSFYYYPINEEYKTFKNLFTRYNYQNNEHFYTESFFKNFKNNIDKIKEFKDSFILGSSAANNYYSNLLQFLPRIFFIKSKSIKIAIHRNSSLKYREFIKKILDSKKIKSTFVYLDDGFYKFINCEMPQFLNLNKSIQALNYLKIFSNTNNSVSKKIYVTREDSAYRKIVNESDIVPILISKGYKVINPNLYPIDEQIKIFSNADKIISAHGSNLANIIFCKPDTEIYEIGPKFNSFESVFENRYKLLAKFSNLKYKRFITDSVSVNNHPDIARKYIDKNILESSNYYKNLIVKLKDLSNIE